MVLGLWPVLQLFVVTMVTMLPALVSTHDDGPIFCRCNTWDCEEQNRAVCSTHYQCYAQMIGYDDSEQETEVTYGCLSRHSILCQNRRPQFYDGNWPIVHCCSSDYCNKDIIPTLPPDWNKDKSATRSSSLSPLSLSSTTSPYDDVHSNSSDLVSPPFGSWAFGFDPLYVAFPVAGVLILIVLIVFAVYILRRPPRASSHCKYHQPPSSSPSSQFPHHNGLVLNGAHNALVPSSSEKKMMALNGNGVVVGHNGFVHADTMMTPNGCHNGLVRGTKPAAFCHDHNGLVHGDNRALNSSHVIHMRPERSPPKVMAVEPFREPSAAPYPDSERSSSGSESKLLAKV